MSKIYIDVGHGKVGEDSGASAKLNGVKYYETEINLEIAKACRDWLVKKGYEVTLSREECVNRPKVGSYGVVASNFLSSAYECRNGDFDLMVSIHNNDVDNNPKANGFIIMWKTGNGRETESKELANKIGYVLSMTTLAKNDIKQCTQDDDGDYYGILRCHDKVGVLIEVAFMSNEEDLTKLTQEKYQVQFGQCIGLGIDSYCAGHNLAPKVEKSTKEEIKVVESATETKSAQTSEYVSKENFEELKEELTALESTIGILQKQVNKLIDTISAATKTFLG